MKPNFKILAMTAFAATAVTIASCSDEDDPIKPDIPEPSPSEVFIEGLPKTVNGAAIKGNDKGQVTSIESATEKVTFTYGPVSRATIYDGLMTITDKTEPNEKPTQIYFNLDSNGFITYALEIDGDGDTDTWNFSYNSDRQLNYMKRSEGDETFNITYTNGDITSIRKSEPGERDETYTVAYTTPMVTEPIANSGAVMLFDQTFEIDLDEMQYAYFAGLLGKATRHLPLVVTDDLYPNETTSMEWTLNANGLPTSVVVYDSYDPVGQRCTFTW